MWDIVDIVEHNHWYIDDNKHNQNQVLLLVYDMIAGIEDIDVYSYSSVVFELE